MLDEAIGNGAKHGGWTIMADRQKVRTTKFDHVNKLCETHVKIKGTQTLMCWLHL
jgi:hypothetical protein